MNEHVKTVDLYAYWREELANPGCNDRDTARDDLSGFWRIKGADTKPDWPMAIWPRNEDRYLNVQIGRNLFHTGTEQWESTVGAGWTKAIAVPEEDYRSALETGRWPDGKHARQMDQSERLGLSGKSGDMGHNLPDDPFERAKMELEALREESTGLLAGKIDSAEKADRCAMIAKKAKTLANTIETLRKAEKQPWIDGGKAVDDKHNPYKAEAEGWADKAKRAADPWLREQARLEQERQKKAREEAERQRREAEEAAAEARRVAEQAERAAGGENDAEAAQEAARAAEEAEAKIAAAREAEDAAKAQKVSAGTTGAKLKQVKVVSAKIVDFDKLLLALKGREEIRELVEKLANRAAKAGVALDGMEIVESTETRL